MNIFKPVHNPELPFNHEVRGMFGGRVIYVYGTLNEDAERFTINLMSGDDKILHFQPRVSEDTVVRNSFLDGAWGDEEREGGLPLTPGEKFDVTIICKKDFFRIKVNGIVLTNYNHRGDYKLVNEIAIDGDAVIERVQQATHKQDWLIGQSLKDVEVGTDVLIPFANIKNHSVTVIGEPTDATSKEDENLFHFNPRADEASIVCNNKTDGEWAEQQVHDGYPFHTGTPYMVRFDVDKTGYDVTINGLKLVRFDHRNGGGKKIHSMKINGDTTIHEIQFR